MRHVVPFMDEVGLRVPAHWDEEQQKFVLEYPFPCEYDESEKRWLFAEGEIPWKQVFERWKGRGPANRGFVAMIQEGRGFRQMLEAA